MYVRNQLDKPLTGEEENGLLAPGKFYAGRLYTLDFTLPMVSEKNESIVFHEERYIRIFLRSKGLPLRKLHPGTFMHVAGQHWAISIEWEDHYFKWTAKSLVSGLFFRGNLQKIELSHGQGIEGECNRILEVITSQIPEEQIQQYAGLREQVLLGLENQGYSEKSPECELRVITTSENHFEYGVFLAVGLQRQPLSVSNIELDDPMNPDWIIEDLSNGVNEGGLSIYNIVNLNEFLDKLIDWVNEHKGNHNP